MTTIYRARRGETLVVPIEAVGATSADLAIVASIEAGLKRVTTVPAVPPASTPRAATFTIAERPSANGVGPGWNLTLTDEETAMLDPGTYVTDAEITLNGGSVVITEPLFIRIEQAVSA